MDAPHQLTYFRIGRRGDGAGVQDRDLAGFKIRSFLESRLKQLLLQRGAIRLAGAATEIEEVKGFIDHKGILAEVKYGCQGIDTELRACAGPPIV